MSGITESLNCTDSSFSGGVLIGYQFATTSNYQSGLTVLDNFLGYVPAAMPRGCSPQTGYQSGNSLWYDHGYPVRNDQLLQCFTINGVPTIIWTFPTKTSIVEAQAPTTLGVSGLLQWFYDNGDPPGAACPGPSTPTASGPC